MPRLAMRLLRFGIVGGAVTLFNYATFLGGIAVGLNYIVASTLAWLMSIGVGFISHRRITFGHRGGWRQQMPRYVGVYLAQLLLGTTTLALLVEWARLAPWLAYLVNILFTASFSYLLMSRAVFGRPRSAFTT